MSVSELISDVLAGKVDTPASERIATSVFWVHHGTRLAGGGTTYLNNYVLVRVGGSFGACSFAEGEIDSSVCRDASGSAVDGLLREAPLALRIAALDAYLAENRPHSQADNAEHVTLPAGTPEQRAHARDAAIAGLLDIDQGAKVGLIGVVNPLIAAIRERGGECLPCDLTLRTTQWGDPVTDSAADVIDRADAVVATGMTLSNGTFDPILRRCRERGIALVVYAQSGSAVAREFLGRGLTALSAETFPFSQFSADPTVLYRYRAGAAS